MSTVGDTAPAEAAPTAPVSEPVLADDVQNEHDGATAGHIPMASRLSLLSWGEGSVPSVPAIDDSASEGTMDDDSQSITNSVVRSTTTSVRSTLYDFVEENGRTYHRYKEGKYPLPNDLQEQARLDLQHAIFILTMNGKLSLAPIEQPKRALDIATGTGIWAIEYALMNPESHVVGTDLSPIQPDFIPPNCQFEVDDAEDDWMFSQPFDYVHGRMLLSCFRQPDTVIRSAFHTLAPGGYLELQDLVFPFRFAKPPPPNCAFQRWMDLITKGAGLAGRPWNNVRNYKAWMEAAGYEDVVERHFYWPLGPWARGTYYKTLGALVLEDYFNGIQGLSLKLCGMLGMERPAIEKIIGEVRHELTTQNLTAFSDIIVVWGRKPGGASSGPIPAQTPVPVPEDTPSA